MHFFLHLVSPLATIFKEAETLRNFSVSLEKASTVSQKIKGNVANQ